METNEVEHSANLDESGKQTLHNGMIGDSLLTAKNLFISKKKN
jgi:hypothetical protein